MKRGFKVILGLLIVAVLVVWFRSTMLSNGPRADMQVSPTAVKAGPRSVDIEIAIKLYKLHMHRYPKDLRELVVQGSDAQNWNGPYIPPVTNPALTFDDPWGKDYRYSRSGDSYRLVSAGPDGMFGTEDDQG